MERLPGADVTAVETSNEMLKLARLHLGNKASSAPGSGIHLIHADVMDFEPSSPFHRQV